MSDISYKTTGRRGSSALRILVIGGTGFIGPYVVRCLRNLGHQIALFHRGKNKAALPAGVKHILGDRQRLMDFIHEFRHFAPKVVVDMFAFSEQDARIVIDTFKGIAERVVVLSSQDVYRAYGRLTGIDPGPIESVPLSEDAPLRETLYPYRGSAPRGRDDPNQRLDDYEKILVERTIMGDPDLPGTVLRLPMVYGPGDRQHRLFEYLKRMDDKRPAILLDESVARWRWTRGYVENIAAGIALAATDERSMGRIYNVGEPEALSMIDWVKAIGKAAGWKGDVVIVSKDQMPTHLRSKGNTQQHLVVDTSRIRKELGYSEHLPRDEALRRTIAWERAHPPDKIDPRRFDYATEDAVLARVNRA